ncbi:amylo-alpha-1,6-glucosidase [Terrihabitans rhizophilus]|uniref:Amylo-alpha-1,6-glucosidase n=1 Tax=Terrihabitans rhizophilus TaxID=3092662 RepID=A0ABU4RIL1_9HYPH|nr:amylo-alpha-1,6-glucosidase [Terrihabitans sp. PJ23]MDX6804667.1 amylo-alpha-1,6-glucosidase [Terrihabitans sp. PJ23]
MNETIAPQFFISALESNDGGRPARLKQGDTFAVLDKNADLLSWEGNPDGLYFHDTRHLSHFEFRLNGARPLLLSSNMESDNSALTVDLTNPDFSEDGRVFMQKDTIHISRSKFIWNNALFERLSIFNYGDREQRLRMSVLFNCDFADLFEARGQRRPVKGVREVRIAGPGEVSFEYMGLDAIARATSVAFHPAPDVLEPSFAVYDMTLGPQDKKVIFTRIACDPSQAAPFSERVFFKSFAESRRALRRDAARPVRITSSSELVDDVVARSMADVAILTTQTEHGLYPYAGIPWFSTPFGRDGIITALMMLWVDPGLAKGVLSYLAATQARDLDPVRDAEPGKILHETRAGEMAMLGEVPFRLYYGSVDSTPLFVLLAGEYLRRTDDVETLARIWPNVQAALGWIETYGDRDGDGFLEYYRQSENGLANQGWKDSLDSVFHADGNLAQGPIALCEVQAYVYGAWFAAAEIAERLGHGEVSEGYRARASAIQERFEEAFWCEDLGTYALALDGEKRRCEVYSSNAGHALLTGIARADRAERVVDALLDPTSFSGWGIRTVATTAARYNPMSYHNGSIWPHDNALIALGMARYGHKDAVLKVTKALIEAAGKLDLQRLPELFCGFPRRQRQGPIGYPVACAPQAWAAATPLALIQACLGLTLHHRTGEILLDRPVLPDFVDQLFLTNVGVGDASADLVLNRHGEDVSLTVLDRRGTVRIVEVR